jgi:Spy/CpxP family protein refolding chaperone
MKKLLLTFAIAASLCVAATSFGQTAGPAGGPPQGGRPGQGGRGQGGGMGGMQRFQQIRAEIFAKLNLTADQKKKVKTLDDANAAKMKTMMADAQKPGADRQKMMDAFKASREDYNKSLAKILSKDQMKKYEALVKEAREKFRAQRGAGKGQAPKQ